MLCRNRHLPAYGGQKLCVVGTSKPRSLLGPFARQSRFPKTLRGKAAVNPLSVKAWEIIADNLSKAGWSWGCISSTDHEGRQFWVAAAERWLFIVRANGCASTPDKPRAVSALLQHAHTGE